MSFSRSEHDLLTAIMRDAAQETCDPTTVAIAARLLKQQAAIRDATPEVLQ